jgi:dolichol-phosphate mannosyltransferase
MPPPSPPLGERAGVRWFCSERLIQFTKFCLVGGSGVFVDMGILYLLADPSRLGWNITLSKICAAEIAMINNFIWNELWTFKASSLSAPGSPRPLDGRGIRGEGNGEWREGRGEVVSDNWSLNPQPSTLNRRGSVFRRFLLFNAICGIGIGLAVLLLHLFHSWLGWNFYLSNLLAIILVTLWNYVMNAQFNWGRYKAGGQLEL